MGWLIRGDEDLHYSDHSHRWIAPPGIDQDLWDEGMRAHMAHHRSGARERPQVSPRDGLPPPAGDSDAMPTT